LETRGNKKQHRNNKPINSNIKNESIETIYKSISILKLFHPPRFSLKGESSILPPPSRKDKAG